MGVQTQIDRINNEVSAQAELIQQIAAVLQEKITGSSTSVNLTNLDEEEIDE